MHRARFDGGADEGFTLKATRTQKASQRSAKPYAKPSTTAEDGDVDIIDAAELDNVLRRIDPDAAAGTSEDGVKPDFPELSAQQQSGGKVAVAAPPPFPIVWVALRAEALGGS